jgi:glycosyltransferase involved in cell wall biosynthesis
MNDFVISRGLTDSIKLLGYLNKSEIASYMRSSNALLHNAHYETFSVVCAESISCGCPVIVNELGAVSEFIDSSNGIIIKNNEEWLTQLLKSGNYSFEREKIAINAHRRFGTLVVGEKFFNINKEIIDRN